MTKKKLAKQAAKMKDLFDTANFNAKPCISRKQFKALVPGTWVITKFKGAVDRVEMIIEHPQKNIDMVDVFIPQNIGSKTLGCCGVQVRSQIITILPTLPPPELP